MSLKKMDQTREDLTVTWLSTVQASPRSDGEKVLMQIQFKFLTKSINSTEKTDTLMEEIPSI